MSFMLPLYIFYIIPEDGGNRFLYNVGTHPYGITFLTTVTVMFTAIKISGLTHGF
jgi:hypothetical protein